MTSHERVVEEVVPDAHINEAQTLAEARQAIASTSFDLAIVDLNLHGDRHAGQEVISAIKQKGQTAIVVISGLDVETFRPLLYAAEVWDYFEKPMDVRSLKLVIGRILQVRSPQSSSVVGPTLPYLDWADRLEKPRWKGRKVNLSISERKVLSLLIKRPNEIVPYADLFDASENWDRDPDRLRRSLTTMISEIRQQFREFDPDFDNIVAASKVGYLWRVEGDG